MNSPLEQFQVIALVSLKFSSLDFSITNFLLINLVCLFSILWIIYNNSSVELKSLFYLIPNSWQKSLEMLTELSAQLINDIIVTHKNKYLPLVSVLFNYILLSNLIGLIPYSFTTTSHLILTFILSFSVFVSINIIIINNYKMKTFSLFLPANTTFFLALLLVPIEFVSYIAKPISLGVRLFINLMAGHSLLKVIIGFSWSMLLLENITSFGLVLPMIVLIILFSLELGVAVIQAYVFIILTCIYITDGS